MSSSTCTVVVRVRPTDEANRDHIQTIKDEKVGAVCCLAHRRALRVRMYIMHSAGVSPAGYERLDSEVTRG